MDRVQPSHALDPIHTDLDGKVPSEFSGGRPSVRLWETGWLNLPESQSLFAAVLIHFVPSGFLGFTWRFIGMHWNSSVT